ncbi:MAG: Pilus assembly protein PilP [Pseudomonadota bacterium]|jgi:Tfp pilus assembly protein PilO
MNKPNLIRIDLWPTYIKSIVIILSMFFTFIVGYFFYLRPALEEKKRIYLSFQFFKNEINSQLKICEKYLIYQEKLKNIKSKFDIHDNDVVDKIILKVLIGQLVDPAFKINKIHVLPIEKKFLNSLQVEIDLSSDNTNIINFLDKISSLNKFIVINKFRWKLSNGLKKQDIFVSFKIYGQALSRKNLISSLISINKIDAKSLSEFTNLSKYPIKKIKMLGFLSDGKYQTWGFVALPNKQICKLNLGDSLGLERGIVIGIFSHEIFIKNNSLDKIIKLEMSERKLPYVKNSS